MKSHVRLPATHPARVDTFDALEYEPAAHPLHADAPDCVENAPAPHSAHADCPLPGEKEPAEHAAQLPVSLVAATEVEYVPAEHWAQTES